MTPWGYAAKTNTEHAHQTALFMWANMVAQFGIEAANNPRSYEEKGFAASFGELLPGHGLKCLELLYAIPNSGHGSKFGTMRGANMKAEGLKAGFPDICLPVANKTCHALYIELKRPKTLTQSKGSVSQEQRVIRAKLAAQGNCVEVCYNWMDACNFILHYLGY